MSISNIVLNRSVDPDLPSARVLLDAEILLSNVGPQTVASLEVEPSTIYVLRATVYADDGVDPTLKTYIRHIGNNQGGSFTQISADGGLSFSLVAAAGGPGTVPITMQAAGPDNNRKTRVIIVVAAQFPYVDV